jgi:hypothetical protein
MNVFAKGVCRRCGREFERDSTSQKFCSFLCSFWGHLRVAGPDECWPCITRYMSGYGKIKFECVNYVGHRVSWMFHVGPIPSFLFVLHKCDNPPCCNPAHLFLGTKGDNWRDCLSKGRANNPVGERSHLSRLKAYQVLEIREMRKAGISVPSLAERFSCGKQNIYAILNGKSWKSV